MIFLNGKQLEFEVFPNGETKISTAQLDGLVKDKGTNVIVFKYQKDADLLHLMFIKKHLDNIGGRNVGTALNILYMPYSRMDRTEGTTVFTLKYVCEFINSLNFDEISVTEPHSDVSCALLDRSFADFPTLWMLGEVIKEIGFRKEYDYLFFPDAGAQKRYSKVKGYNQIVGYKERDFETGRINKLDIVGLSESLEGKKVIIVDDLCSYGGTFDLSATKLKELGAQEVHLLVAHAENAIFDGKIFNRNSPIKKVFATNSIVDEYTAELTDGKMVVFNII